MAKARVRLLAYTAGGGPGKVWDECCKGVFILLSSLFNFYCLIFGLTEYCCTCAAVVSIASVTYSEFWYSNGRGFVYYQKVMHIFFSPFLETYIFSNAKNGLQIQCWGICSNIESWRIQETLAYSLCLPWWDFYWC